MNKERLEENQKAQLSGSIASTWLSIRLQMIGVVMVTGVAFVAVLEHHFRTVNPGLFYSICSFNTDEMQYFVQN